MNNHEEVVSLEITVKEQTTTVDYACPLLFANRVWVLRARSTKNIYLQGPKFVPCIQCMVPQIQTCLLYLFE